MKKFSIKGLTVVAAFACLTSIAGAHAQDYNNGGNYNGDERPGSGEFNRGGGDRDGDGIVSKRLKVGDSATVIAPNRRGDFIRHDFTCEAGGGKDTLITTYTCISYKADSWTVAWKLTQKVLNTQSGLSYETVLADNLNQESCLKRADTLREKENR